jgi:hypothetical protein
MKSWTIKALIIIALFIPLTGCPSSTSFVPGVWVFSLLPDGDLAMTRAIDLLADGTSMTPAAFPPTTGTAFTQPATWAQMGSNFTLTQVLAAGAQVYVYTGTIYSDTVMAGTFEQTVGGNFNGRWTALRQP